MISGLDLTATIDYSLKDDKENPTIFKLGVMPSYLLAKISASQEKNEIEVAYRILQFTLKGWSNFDIAFETAKEKIFDREVDVVPISILEKLPLKVITELSFKAMEVNRLTDGERKN